MPETENVLSIGKAEYEEEKTHVPSKIQADTLFHFMTKLEYLIEPIKRSFLSPRYCEEDISYLKIPEIKKISIPMLCFCDINLHRMSEHLEWYGSYGIAFEKEWGMRQKIQPLQYINPDSELCNEFSSALSNAIKTGSKNSDSGYNEIRSFLLHQLMYYKPYSGKFNKRSDPSAEKKMKCFADECEWRFVPKMEGTGYKQIYYDRSILEAGGLKDISAALARVESVRLPFNYDEIKYIIVRDVSDFQEMVNTINDLKIDDLQKSVLISKTIIWNRSKGDF